MKKIDIEVKDELIPGTNIHRPRDRKPGETDDEYVNGYLIGQYYSRFFPQSIEEGQKKSLTEENSNNPEKKTRRFEVYKKDKSKKTAKKVSLELKAEDVIIDDSIANKYLIMKTKLPIMKKQAALGFTDELEKILSLQQVKSKNKDSLDDWNSFVYADEMAEFPSFEESVSLRHR